MYQVRLPGAVFLAYDGVIRHAGKYVQGSGRLDVVRQKGEAGNGVEPGDRGGAYSARDGAHILVICGG